MAAAIRPPATRMRRVQVQRTVRCNVRRAYAALTDPKAIRKWAGAKASVDAREGGALRIGADAGFLERLDPHRRLRVRWGPRATFPHSTLDVDLVARGRDRTTVLFTHTGRFGSDNAKAVRDAWREALQRFQMAVEPRPYDPRVPSRSHRAPRRPRVPGRLRPARLRAAAPPAR